MTKPVRIVAAALRRKGLIFSAPPPARHHTLMHAADGLFGSKHKPFLPSEQGFLGSDGKFYSRRAAKLLAFSAGQATSISQPSAELFSEDLW